ncbi:DUF6446 family protein [Pseudooceanicola algae]|uniref:Histidine kinase n=1 Tax=Pseudooceanicola algae TaxID=1537215 RepID=A0A418SEY6_9RHOB|nr:DUF6446 family protein [Pseudooceanicola algae]QPM89058.1 hypothetical protein PSAL_002670 [Pseudooceanicola algae]
MLGRIAIVAILVCALLAGGGLFYLQIWGYYDPVVSRPGQDVAIVPLGDTSARPISYSDFEAIDADSSPIRYRACFTPMDDLATLETLYEPYPEAEPLNAPFWFGCFDAGDIGEALESGTAKAFLGGKNFHYGVDRVIAVTEEGQGYVWHQLNNCGERSYDGTPVGEACPPR